MSIKSMPVWKWILLFIVSLVLGFILLGFGQFANYPDYPWWVICLVNIAVPVAMIALYALFVKIIEREPAHDLPMKRLAGETGKGFGIGALFFVAVVAVMMIAGVYKFLKFNTGNADLIIAALFFYLTVAVGEEILFRGILFRWIDSKWGFVPALIVSALFFGVAHIFQPGASWWSSIAIAIEAGLLLAAAYKYSGTLWLPIGIHWGWNFFQGNIFGIEVSDSDAGESLIIPEISGPDILTGGAFGAEASIVAFLLGLALSVWFIVKVVKKK
jgi:hypothetical protein